MSDKEKSDLRDEIKSTNPENLYQIKDSDDRVIDFEQANGRQLFNHYRHNMTNYDEVLDDIREQQGHVKGYQQKKAVMGAAEQVLAEYHKEHIKVVQDSQNKGNILKQLFRKAKVGTASALVNLLDDWSEQIKKVGSLENSQRSLRVWNDTYRVQQKLVKKLIEEADIDPKVKADIKVIYSARSVNKAVEKACGIFDLEKSEIIKLVKTSIRYSKLIDS